MMSARQWLVLSARARACCLASNAAKLATSQLQRQPESSRQLHSSAAVWKVRKDDKKKKGGQPPPSATASDHQVLKDASKEMTSLLATLREALTTQSSTNVDLRPYENLFITLDDQTEHKLGRLGRVSLKGARTICINLADSPAAIKAVKLALQKSATLLAGGVVEHQGVMLYLTCPPMSRERREHIANDMTHDTLNDFKKAVNLVYSKSTKRAETETKSQDELHSLQKSLLSLKRGTDESGTAAAQEAKKKLFEEVI